MKEEEKEKQMSRVQQILKVASMIAALLAVSISFLMLWNPNNKTLSHVETTKYIEKIDVRLSQQEKSLKELTTSLSQLRNEIVTLSRLPKGAEWKIEASHLNEKMNLLERKHQALEAALTTDPEKALAIPIIRKDMDSMEKSLRAELKDTKLSIDRIYDQNKWFMGLMFTIALSVLGIAIGNFFTKKST